MPYTQFSRIPWPWESSEAQDYTSTGRAHSALLPDNDSREPKVETRANWMLLTHDVELRIDVLRIGMSWLISLAVNWPQRRQ